MELKGKVALITGASSGIGEGVAKSLAAKGVKVGLAARNIEKLKNIEQEILQEGGDAFSVKMDVSDKESVKTGLQLLLEKYGTIDILINNAGIMPAADIDMFKLMNGRYDQCQYQWGSECYSSCIAPNDCQT